MIDKMMSDDECSREGCGKPAAMGGEACEECAALLASNVTLRAENRRLQNRMYRLTSALEAVRKHAELRGALARKVDTVLEER